MEQTNQTIQSIQSIQSIQTNFVNTENEEQNTQQQHETQPQQTLPNHSLCFPCIDKNIKHYEVIDMITKMNIGEIERVDIVPVRNTVVKRKHEHGMYKFTVFVHFKEWYNNERNIKISSRLQKNKMIYICANDVDIWKCVLYKNN